MALTLLQIVDQAAAEMGIQAPATVISNTTLYVIQMLNLANGLGINLSSEHQWQQQDIEYRFTTVYYQYTADLSTSSTTISNMSSTTGLTTTPTYFTVTGDGIPQDTTLVSVNGGASTAVLSQTPTTAGTAATLTFAQTQYAFPSGFGRLIDRTDWSKTQRWEMLGPETAQQWQWLKSSYIATGPRIRYRQLGNTFQIWPPQADNLYLGFEYMTNFWVIASGGTTPSKASFTVDTDTCVYPDNLMVAGLKWRWAVAKQSPTSQLYYQEYTRLLDQAKTADAGSPTLAMAPQPASVLLTWNNIPDSNLNV